MLVYEGVSEIYQSIERMEMLEDTFNQKSKMLSKNLYPSKQQMRFEDILGNSQAIPKVKQLPIKASETKATVLITGEPGVGKEQFAHAIHNANIKKNEILDRKSTRLNSS